MSVFTVNLNTTAQGTLDTHPTTGAQNDPSIQRQVYIMGPNKVNRLLSDGESFTDCNYYKRFCPYDATTNPYGCALENAILTLTTDDGSIYSDVPSENTYPLVEDLSIVAGTTYTDTGNYVDILGTTGGYAVFAQLTNTHATQDVQVRLNGATTAIFTLEAASTQVFNAGDLSISKIEIDNSTSGAVGPVAVQIVLSVRSVCNS